MSPIAEGGEPGHRFSVDTDQLRGVVPHLRAIGDQAHKISRMMEATMPLDRGYGDDDPGTKFTARYGNNRRLSMESVDATAHAVDELVDLTLRMAKDFDDVEDYEKAVYQADSGAGNHPFLAAKQAADDANARAKAFQDSSTVPQESDALLAEKGKVEKDLAADPLAPEIAAFEHERDALDSDVANDPTAAEVDGVQKEITDSRAYLDDPSVPEADRQARSDYLNAKVDAVNGRARARQAQLQARVDKLQAWGADLDRRRRQQQAGKQAELDAFNQHADALRPRADAYQREGEALTADASQAVDKANAMLPDYTAYLDGQQADLDRRKNELDARQAQEAEDDKAQVESDDAKVKAQEAADAKENARVDAIDPPSAPETTQAPPATPVDDQPDNTPAAS